MGITAKFNSRAIKAFIKAKKQDYVSSLATKLINAGHRFVDDARVNKQFVDRTKNLVSSFGSIVTNDGYLVDEYFPGETEEGVNTAREVAIKASLEFPKGLALIVVAGMDYALAVEAKGFDVITGTSFLIERQLKETIKQ